MKERQIGELFEHPTHGRLRVCQEGAVNECYGCAFNSIKACLNDTEKFHSGACAASERSDRQGVIFVKIKKGEDY